MRKILCYVAVLVGLGVFAICSSAQALTFTVSDINFTDLSGDNEGFRWSVSSVSVGSFDLNAGEQYTFTYGQFYTDDFPINPTAGSDNDDKFRANFKVAPPNPSASYDSLATPDATNVTGSALGSAIVDFDNTLIDRYFDVTGHYTIQFLDVPEFSGDGFRNLQATLNYLMAPTTNGGGGNGPAPVPEPSTIVLLASGLLGLLYVGRKRSRR